MKTLDAPAESSAARPAKPPTCTLDDERVVPGITDQGTYAQHVARYEFVRRLISPGQRLLETACGSGYGTQLLSGCARSVIGVDYSPLALGFARAHFPAPNLHFAQMDIHRLAFADASFDAIVSFEVFEHLEEPERYLDECRRVLRPGGCLAISTPNGANWNAHMKSIGQEYAFHINLVGLKRFRSMLSGRFDTVTIFAQRRRGSPLYAFLRGLDIFNLRIKLLRPERRERMQAAFGVPTGPRLEPHAWLFTRSQLRQANTFVALCRKSSQ